MAADDDEKAQRDAAMATPLGQAFERLFTEEGFAAAVADDPGTALAGYDLSSEDTEALVTDAEALEGEVAGFNRGLGRGLGRGVGNPLDMSQHFGGMRTPPRLGLQPSAMTDFTSTLTNTI